MAVRSAFDPKNMVTTQNWTVIAGPDVADFH